MPIADVYAFLFLYYLFFSFLDTQSTSLVGTKLSSEQPFKYSSTILAICKSGRRMNFTTLAIFSCFNTFSFILFPCIYFSFHCVESNRSSFSNSEKLKAYEM